MGLFDMFGGNDPQQMGLLSAAAQILQASGPSLMPHSFGQIAGQGVMAGLQASDQARQSQQMQALRGLQMDELKGSLADKDKARKDILDAQALMAQRRAGATPAAPMPAPQSADALFKATMGATQPSLPSPGQALTTGGLSPDYLQSLPTVNAQPSAPQQPAPAPGQMPQTLDVFKQRMDDAQWMRSTGNPILAAQADKLEEQALKFRPKYDMTPHVVMGADGKPTLVQTADDGTVRPINGGYGVAEKLSFQDLGGKVAGLDPYTGKPITSLGKSQSPDSMAADRRAKEEKPVDPAQVENVAQMISTGRMAPLGQMAMRSPFGWAVMSRVSELNPNFRAQDFGTSSKAEKDFATGKQGNSVRSFNVSLAHLDTLNQLADALNNGNVQMVNKIGNLYASQTGNPAPTNFEAAKKIVGDEVVKAIVGSGGGVADREEAAKTIAAANSPAQLKGVIKTYQELMVGQLGGLEQQYRTTTGRDDFNKYLSDQAKSMYHPAGQASATATPGAKVATLSDIAATAKASGKSTAQVTADLRAAGYTIGGQ